MQLCRLLIALLNASFQKARSGHFLDGARHAVHGPLHPSLGMAAMIFMTQLHAVSPVRKQASV